MSEGHGSGSARGSRSGRPGPPAPHEKRWNPDEVREEILRGAPRLGVELDERALSGLLSHLDELRLWAARINLVSSQDLANSRTLVERHVLDSLAAVPLVEPLGPAPRILDIGSGAGFPGIPVAVVAGSSRTLLVEPRQRRASFLRAVARRLPGFGVEVADRRFQDLAEDLVAPGFDAILSRAALPLADLLDCAGRWLRPGGRLVSFRGPTQRDDDPAPESDLRRLPDRTYGVGVGSPKMRLAAWERPRERAD